ncbi:saccharopine dehydrogenase NADP-binding domain-containing protein [bacterium]|nr:saccharopine dehydrogenase NADP-binding domain-containing protein [bacterium]
MGDATILILGGYGETGKRLARYLLASTTCRIVVGGRDASKAESFAAELNDSQMSDRVLGIRLDATERESVRDALQGVNLFIQAGPALPEEVVRLLAEEVLNAAADWIDIQLDSTQAAILSTFEERMKEEGRCFVTQGGYHPGLPALLIRWAARHSPHLEKAIVSSYLNQKGGLPFTSGVDELMDMFRGYEAHMLHGGEWVKVKGTTPDDFPKVTFPFGIGKQMTTPMDLEEMKSLTEIMPDIKESGFLIGGFNWFTNYIVSPIVMVGMKVLPFIPLRSWGRLFSWSCCRFARPPYGVVVQVEARGQKNGQEYDLSLAMYHDDGYDLTAIPVVATIRQMLDGTCHTPGLYFQAWLPEPTRMIRDMQKMGVKILERITPLNNFINGAA